MESLALPGFNVCLRWLKAKILLDDDYRCGRNNRIGSSIARRKVNKKDKMPVLPALIDLFISCCILCPQSSSIAFSSSVFKPFYPACCNLLSFNMRFLLSSFLTASLGLVSAMSVESRGDSRKRAAYILSNNPEGNNILALSISTKDGTVSDPVLTPTGGKGLLGLTANGTAGPDGLFSQGAVTVSRNVSLPQTLFVLTIMTIIVHLYCQSWKQYAIDVQDQSQVAYCDQTDRTSR